MPSEPQVSGPLPQNPSLALENLFASSADLMALPAGLAKVAQRIGVPLETLRNLQIESGQNNPSALLTRIMKGDIPGLSRETVFRQIACLIKNIQHGSSIKKTDVEKFAKRFCQSQPGFSEKTTFKLVFDSLSEMINSGLLGEPDISAALATRGIGLLKSYAPFPAEIATLIKTSICRKLVTSVSNQYELQPELARMADAVRLQNFEKLDSSIQIAYLQGVSNSFPALQIPRLDLLKAAISSALGNLEERSLLVNAALDQPHFVDTWNNDPLLAVQTVNSRLAQLCPAPVAGGPVPADRSLNQHIERLVENYSSTLGRMATITQIREACCKNLVKFLMSAVPEGHHRPENERAMHAREFAQSVFTDLLGPENVHKFNASQFTGCFVRAPALGAEQFGYTPTVITEAGPTGKAQNLSGRKVEMPRLGASKMNFTGALAQQRIFQPSVNMLVEKFYDLTLKPKLGSRTYENEKILRNSARDLGALTHRAGNVFRLPNPAPKTTYQKALNEYVGMLRDYTIGNNQIPKETSDLIGKSLEDFVLAKYSQAGFHARKYDRVLKDQTEGTNKRLEIRAPGNENSPLSDYKVNTSRFKSFFRSSRTYGISDQRPNKFSNNAARLRFSEHAGDYLMAELIKTSDGVLPNDKEGVKNQLAQNIGLADLKNRQTWGDLAEKAKLVFVACTDVTLRTPVGPINEKASHGSLLMNKILQYTAKSERYHSDRVDAVEVEEFLNIAKNAIAHNTGWPNEANPNAVPEVPRAGLFNNVDLV